MVKIISGYVKDYGNLDNTYFQVFYVDQNILTSPKHLNQMEDGTYLDTYTLSAQYPETEIGSGDRVVLFFWEGTEDKSEIVKLSCMEYVIHEEEIIRQNIHMLDYTKAFTIKLDIGTNNPVVKTEIDTPFDFSTVVGIDTHFTYLLVDGQVYVQEMPSYDFFNWRNYVETALFVDGQEIDENTIISKVGTYQVTGMVKVFQFEFTIDFTYIVVEKAPSYIVNYEPSTPLIESPVTFTVDVVHRPEEIQSVVMKYDGTQIAYYPSINAPISSKYIFDNITPKAKPYGVLSIETTYFDGIEETTAIDEFKVFYSNVAPIVKISNKDDIQSSNLSLRNFNIFLDSRSAKKFIVKWSLKIPQRDDWLFIYSKEIFSFDEYSSYSGLKVLPVEILGMQGTLRAEIVVEDSFGDIGSDFVEFENSCNKYEASNASLLSSTVSFL